MEALKKRGYDVLASMRYVKLDMNLLYAAIEFWDVKTHCFMIRDHEISLLEELSAIVSLPCSGSPCLPNISDYFYRDYERYLGLDPRALRKIVHGREIDLIALADHFKSVEPSRMVFRDRAILVCLLGRFLFMNNNPAVGHAALVILSSNLTRGGRPCLYVPGSSLLLLIA